jgi:hypothetical protein
MSILYDGLPSNGLGFSRAPASTASLDRESVWQKTYDLDRPSRGVGWKPVLGRRPLLRQTEACAAHAHRYGCD